MIKVLGKRRVLLLLLLVALNGIFGAVLYLYLIPHKRIEQNDLKSIKSQVNTVRADLDYVHQEFEQLEFQRGQFEKLRLKGFFNTQKRRQAEDVFEQIQKQSGVISAKASISSGKAINTEDADKAEYAVLASPISVTIEALDDVSIYNYIYLLQNYFPGYVTIEDVSMKRKEDISGGVLRAVAGGKNPALIAATLKLTWRTMIPKSSVITKEGEGGGAQ